MIHLLPHSAKRIISEKTPEDIYIILKSVTDSRKAVLSTNAEFVGLVQPFDFRIVPKINYRNSFLPVLIGNITEKEEGTVIDITFHMPVFMQIFLIIWYGMACFLFLCGILAVFTGGAEQTAFILVPSGFIVLGQVLSRCCFYGPEKKSFNRLKELLCQ
ncbi:MAG: hypothetical protein K2P59_09600 [Acetatifactor sp.]|nr:hypothetical protein [Acetatifactor sp.]